MKGIINPIRTVLVAIGLAFVIIVIALSGGVQAQDPLFSLSPVSGPGGTGIQVNGEGFINSPCGVNLFFDSTDGTFLTFASIDDGSFSASIIIPANATPGEHIIIAQGLEYAGEFCGGPSGEEASATFTVTALEGDFDFKIYLKSRIIDIDCTIDSAFLEEIQSSPNLRTHGIVQLYRLPLMGSGDLEVIEELGITLLNYLNGISNPGTAYIASIAKEVKADDPRFNKLVRCLQRILPEDKIQLGLLPVSVPPAVSESDTSIDVLVQFFRDVDIKDAASVLEALGLEAQIHATPNVLQTTASPAQIESLAAEDTVQWIEGGPLPFLPTLDEVRDRSNVDVVQDLDTTTGVYNGLSGAGIQIAIMDSGVDSQHNDFAGRIIRAQDDGASHGTHVAGIAGGSGFQSNLTDDGGNPPFCCPLGTGTAFQWRGMAPQAGIAAYSQAGGNTLIYFDAINNFGVDVSNHSYILVYQNDYTIAVALVDAVARGDSPGIPAHVVVWAAANNASVNPQDCDGDGVDDGSFPQYPSGCPTGFQAGYFSILSPAKNPVVVGSVDKNRIHTYFSSMGPTMDGRLKPDVVAVGHDVTSTRSDTFGGYDMNDDHILDFFPGGNGYIIKSGTSMASPAVAGIAALMLEQYVDTFHVNLDIAPPLPSTIKAILVQTASDLAGTDTTVNFDTGVAVTYGNGPDWATGYGLVDAGAAVQLIADKEFIEEELDIANPTDEFKLLVLPGQTEVKVTLAWDDIAGTPNANDAAAQIVNDLDLTLIEPDGTEHHPLVLPLLTPNDCDGNAANGVQVGTCPGQDPAGQNYFGPAAEGVDRRNNVEQVVVNDEAGFDCGIWMVRVSVLNDDQTVRLPLGGTQPYSLAGLPPEPPPLPQIQIPSTDLSFETICFGETSTQTLYVCNTSSWGDNLEILGITSSDSQFTVTEPSSGYPLLISPDFCFPFKVTFSPITSGSHSATIRISSNDLCNPNVEIMVTGSQAEPDINISIVNNGNFGNVCLGDQKDLNLQVINQGGCDLEISSIASSNVEFILPSNLTPLILSPNANADIPIRFQPDDAQACSNTVARSGNIIINSDDPDEHTVTQAVSGIVPCPVAATSGDLDFGQLCIGDSENSTVQVCNTGGCNLSITRAELSGPDCDDLILVSPSPPPTGDDPLIISPDFCFEFVVKFTPDDLTPPDCMLEIDTDDFDNPTIVIPIEATVDAPHIALMIADNGNFGDICLGAFKDLELTISNSGGCDLLVQDLSSSSSEFQIAGVMSFPLVIFPGNSLQVPIRFRPASIGSKTADITVTSNDPMEPSKIAGFSGNTPPPVATTSGDLDFGQLCIGDSENSTVQVCNTGGCNLSITRAELSGPDCDDLILVSPSPPPTGDDPLIISPDFCFEFVVKFTPDDLTPPDCMLEIDTDDPDNPTIVIPIEATVGAPHIVLDPPNLTGAFAFPPTVEDSNRDLGCFSEQALVIRNTGDCPLEITNIFAEPSPAFEVTAPSQLPIVLPPGEETLQVTVRFAPDGGGGSATSPDETSGTLTVVSNDPGGDSVAVLCGETVVQSGVRVLVLDDVGTPVDSVDFIQFASRGIHTPSPISIRMRKVPLVETTTCDNTVRFHLNREDLPPVETTGSNPKSSYILRVKKGKKQANMSFTLGQCEFKEIIVRLQ